MILVLDEPGDPATDADLAATVGTHRIGTTAGTPRATALVEKLTTLIGCGTTPDAVCVRVIQSQLETLRLEGTHRTHQCDLRIRMCLPVLGKEAWVVRVVALAAPVR